MSIDEIIAGMTEAQRKWLLNGDWNLSRPLGGFLLRGLATRTGETEWPYWAELTPLGETVRARLEEQSND